MATHQSALTKNLHNEAVLTNQNENLHKYIE